METVAKNAMVSLYLVYTIAPIKTMRASKMLKTLKMPPIW